MIVLVPLGGIGQRFKDNGYKKPKALINVYGKPIISYLLDNLNTDNIEKIYLTYNKEYSDHGLENFLKIRYPSVKFIFLKLEKGTRGAAETISITLDQIKEDKPILCLDADNFYYCDIINKWQGENKIFTVKNFDKNPKYSYVKIFQKNIIAKIKEKEKISDNACCGAYGFSSSFELKKYCKLLIKNNIKQKNEFYTSGVISEMIKDKKIFFNETLDNKDYFSLGTPEQIKYFEKTFLLDLDGTLFNTDQIYIEVWNKILKKYNIDCEENFFNHFIRGNSDYIFLKYLLGKNITNEQIIEISREKDNYFCYYLRDKDVIFEGVKEFFEQFQNSKIAIVTSCNKISANQILKKYDLKKYVNCIISSEDVSKHKPHPEPYLQALKILNRELENTIVFEDSYTGYLSALNAGIKKIFIYNNGKNLDLVKKIEDNIINNYRQINELIFSNSNKKENLLEIIRDNLIINLPISNISKDNHSNLKTGYICDIKKYIINLKNKENINIILKISNNDNELSKVAQQLNMYKKELYFYKNISFLKGFNVPKYYGSFNYSSRIGILLEELDTRQGKFNLDLNLDINSLLKVINLISKIHINYYFKNKNQINTIMKDLERIKDITYYKNLINERFNKFIKRNKKILEKEEIFILNNIYKNFDYYLEKNSNFPLSFCHGDLKSPNIYYKNNKEIFFLDWQYIHLNKGISDITFLLVESLIFDKRKVKLVLEYYYLIMKEKINDFNYEEMIEDFKNSLCIFPFFVMVWFNSEDPEKLIDRIFPIRFMKNTLEYYKYFFS